MPPSRKSCYNFRVTKINKVVDGDTIDVTIDLGFDLAKKAAEVYEQNPKVEGLLLLNHGHFAFSDTAKQSYDRIVSHTNEVAKYFKLGAATQIGKRQKVKGLHFLPVLRGVIAALNGSKQDPMPIFDLRNSSEITKFFQREDIDSLVKRGMASPDHVLRTKGSPVFLKQADAVSYTHLTLPTKA